MALNPKSLEPELARWRAAGWVDADGAEAILADARARRPQQASASSLLVLLGALLLCLAAAAFVAANWPAIPRPGKLALCIGLLWAAYAAAAVADMRRASALAHAFALLGASLFGSGIMLVSQMYHMSGAIADLFLVWGLGALATGALLRTTPSLVLAALLFIGWDVTSAEAWTSSGWTKPVLAHLAFPPVWALTAAALWRRGWRGGFHLVAIGLLYWVLQLGFRVSETNAEDSPSAWLPVIAIAALAFGAGLWADRHPTGRARAEPLRAGLGATVAIYAFIALFLALLAVAAMADDFGALEALLLLAPTTGALWIGAAGGSRGMVGWAVAGLAVALVTIYVATVANSMLGTAVFFLAAALGVGGVAWIAFRLDRARADTGGET